jgi:hypothetical protein
MSLTKMPSKLRASQLNISIISGTTAKSVLGKKKVTNPMRGFELAAYQHLTDTGTAIK